MMKRILYLLSIYIFCTFIAFPCSADEKLNIAGNWKLIRTYINSSGGYIEDITFYDALGYADQIINVGASPNGKNIVLPIWYDNMRRGDAKSYLPYVSLSNSATVKESTPFSSQESFYTSYINSSEASYAYYRNSYEPSILNRVTQQYNTGSVYSNRPQALSYLSNTSGQVKKLDINSGNSITISTYSAGDLYCTQVTNEDGSLTETFTDKSSRKVLERTFDDTVGWIQTYYGYDDLGRLSWVISPEGVALLPQSGTLLSSSVIGSKYSYIYKYDGKNNIVEKTIPSKGTEFYIYDNGGRVVMSQDQNQRENNHWVFMVYDNINRLVERSLVNTSLSRIQIQQDYNSATNNYPNPAWSERVDIPFGSSSYTPIQSLESIRYSGGEYMPVYNEQQYQITLSNSVYLEVDTLNIIHWGAHYHDPYGFYLQEDDNVQSIYYICSDANYPEIKYYYIPNVFMDIAQTLTEVDPFEAYQFVYSYPCSGTPESSMTITSGIPPQTRSNSLPAFTIPSYLGFSTVSGVVGTSDLDTINIHSSKVYERVALLEEGLPASLSKSVERAFYYDYLGRVIQTVEKNHLGGISRTSSKYDFLGNLLSLHESHQSSSTASADIKLTNYSYDTRSRLLSETTSVNSQVNVTVSYSYDNLGKLIAKTYGNGVKEDLTYNIQGWLKSKNTAKSGVNIFNMTLRYYDPLYASSLYSGNISEMQWQHATGTGNAYAFSYDKLGRLVNTGRYLNGTPQTSFTEKDITYDNNGNITSLKRYASNASIPQDNFSYSYNGNSLTSITGTINALYSHDGNGNITVDGRKNLQIEYNLFNLPQTVKQGSVSKARYSWLSDGTKASVVEDTLSNTGYSYLGSMVYAIAQGVHTLESVSFSSGQIINTTGAYSPYYHTTDHLGSIRAITTSTGAIAEQNDYYPFGQRTNLGQSYSLLSANRYKYNGKEEQTTGNLQYLDYGARFYDPTIARWLSVDPLAEKYSPISPYAYVANNPLIFIDPDGREVIALNSAAQRAILNTLPKEIRGQIQFANTGRIDRSSFNQINTSSGNFRALSQLVNDNTIFEVNVADKIAYRNEKGQLIEKSMGAITLSDDKNGSFGFNTGEEGWQGVTQTPGNSPEKYNSPDGNVRIIVNSGLSVEGQAQNFAHEAYGHGYLYSKDQEHRHQVKSTPKGFKETNTNLRETITRAIKETINNMLNR